MLVSTTGWRAGGERGIALDDGNNYLNRFTLVAVHQVKEEERRT